MESRTQSDSIEDIFESTLNLEQTHLKEGYDEGYNYGLVAGKEEARQVGLKTGFEVGEELGFYLGCIDIWNSAIQIDPTGFSARVQKYIKQMEELIEKYSMLNPEDERVQEIMDSLRLKFRVIRAQEIMDSLRLKFRVIRAGLGVKLEYDGYPKPTEVEF